MTFEKHDHCQLQVVTLGREGAKLLVIDQFIDKPDSLVEQAAGAHYAPAGMAYPGLRAVAPRAYQDFIMSQLAGLLREHFDACVRSFRLMMCHYSLVTTPPEQLVLAQRIPHVDTLGPDGFATVHYLFQQPYGGTAFYRHKATGFETLDESRKATYFQALEAESRGSAAPPPSYINGDSPQFEQIERREGLYNRILIYRGNSLHSGCIDKRFLPDADPRSGRLTLNSFVAALR
ncbi:DUF6445 family protein [Gilvimarinus algae]|uniref:DUF6445 family protein n=1 Tax=Gilvimarinus algae TaxID=3058037 RepID=A0ABT8TDC5_9GAMM|nr:DUF6445 family protein [Gilvimarinus sp. SDUM040014]MDO3382038.1 DUF6445 family protein [Gilvimarinus sp. SDUM040014]